MQYSKIIEEEGVESSVVVHWDTTEGNGGVVAYNGYGFGVGNLCNAEDTDNGYIFHFPSYSSVSQDNYICLDYAEADYIFELLKFIKKINKGKAAGKEETNAKTSKPDKKNKQKPVKDSCKEVISSIIEDDDQDCNCTICKKAKQSLS